MEKEIVHIDLQVAPGQAEPVRLDKYLTVMVKNATRNRVQEAIKEGRVTVNGKKQKSSYIVQPDDEIRVEMLKFNPPDATAEEIPLDVVHEDESLLIVNKPPGMVVHPAFGNWSGTMVNALLHHTEHLSDLNNDSMRPGIVHRLDKDTSGLLVVAKNEHVHKRLARQFAKHSTKRTYWAVVWGNPDDEGTFTGNIGRSSSDRKKQAVVGENQGKRAVTHYRVLERFDHLSLVEIKLETGRTHQIRVHFAHNNHHVFGDEVYGGASVRYGSNTGFRKTMFDKLFTKLNRQCLHAKTLGFIHPESGEEVLFDSEIPEDFEHVLDTLRKYCA